MSITTIIGPMFSGKTTELIRLIDRKRISGKKCLIIKHTQDNRFDDIKCKTKKIDHLTTHSDLSYRKCHILHMTDFCNLELVDSLAELYDVVGIDEGFFFKNLANFCNSLANNGIDVFVSTIESSYKQELFHEVGYLIAISENVIKMRSICMMCKNKKASFNIRTIDDDQEIVVGGADIYQCVCRKCLLKFKREKSIKKQIKTIDC